MLRIRSIKDIPDEIRQIIECFYMQDENKARDEAIRLRHANPEFKYIMKDVLQLFGQAPNGISLFYDELVSLQGTAEDRLGDSSIPGLSFKNLRDIVNDSSLNNASSSHQNMGKAHDPQDVEEISLPKFDLLDPALEDEENPQKESPKKHDDVNVAAPAFNFFDIFPSESKVPATKMSLFNDSFVPQTKENIIPTLSKPHEDKEDNAHPFSLLNTPLPEIAKGAADSDKQEADSDENDLIIQEHKKSNIEDNDFDLFANDKKLEDQTADKDDFDLFEHDELSHDQGFNFFDDDNIDLNKEDDFDLFDEEDHDFHLFDDDNENIDVENGSKSPESVSFPLFADENPQASAEPAADENPQASAEPAGDEGSKSPESVSFPLFVDENPQASAEPAGDEGSKSPESVSFPLFADENPQASAEPAGDEGSKSPESVSFPLFADDNNAKQAQSESISMPSKSSEEEDIDDFQLFLSDDLSDIDLDDAPDLGDDGFNLDIELDFDMDAPDAGIEDNIAPVKPVMGFAPPKPSVDFAPPKPSIDFKAPKVPSINAQQFVTPVPTHVRKPESVETAGTHRAPDAWFTQSLGDEKRYSGEAPESKPTAEALEPVQEVSAMRGRPGITFGSTVSQRPDVSDVPSVTKSKAVQLSQGSGLFMPPVGGAGFHKASDISEKIKPTSVALPPVGTASIDTTRPTTVAMQAIASGNTHQRDPERENMALQTLEPHHRIPRLRIPLAELSKRRDINPRAGFILSNVDGITSIRDILDISAFSEPQTALLLLELEEQGVISFR